MFSFNKLLYFALSCSFELQHCGRTDEGVRVSAVAVERRCFGDGMKDNLKLKRTDKVRHCLKSRIKGFVCEVWVRLCFIFQFCVHKVLSWSGGFLSQKQLIRAGLVSSDHSFLRERWETFCPRLFVSPWFIWDFYHKTIWKGHQQWESTIQRLY